MTDFLSLFPFSSQRAAGHGRAGVRRDVPGEASAAPVRGVRVRLPSEHAQ